MSASSREQKLLKLVLGAIASDTLQEPDYQAALESLRSGKLIEVLDVVLSALAEEQLDRTSSEKSSVQRRTSELPKDILKTPDELTSDVKRRKVGRERLEEILHSIDKDILDSIIGSDTIRSLIKSFRDKSSDRQWRLLVAIVNGQYGHDPHFNGDA